MTPSPSPKPTPWWQTLVALVINAGVGALLTHFFGGAAGVAGMAAGTGVAHLLPSPIRKLGS
jgi:hypothetical protein